MSEGHEMIGRKFLVSVIALLALATTGAAGAISASSGDDDRGQGGNQIVGSWELNVDRGPALPPVRALTTFTRDGSMIDTANLATRTPSHGVWEHVKGRLYSNTHIFFRFDPAGVFLGTQKINETVRLARDGESFTAVAISDLFDPSGNLVLGGLRATITATRIHVQRIPDQP
jgi:hypothetical protein